MCVCMNIYMCVCVYIYITQCCKVYNLYFGSLLEERTIKAMHIYIYVCVCAYSIHVWVAAIMSNHTYMHL